MKIDYALLCRASAQQDSGGGTSAPECHGVLTIGGNILGKQVPFDLQDVEGLCGMAELAVVGGLFLYFQLLIPLRCPGCVEGKLT
ncbi:MAG: hypothetical protein AB2552_06135 [Candidatus Thiodiazotropha endolucinida]